MSRKVEIEKKSIIFDDFFKIEEAYLRYEHFNGRMTTTLRRLSFERGDAVAALLYNKDTRKVILTNQFRYPTYGKSDGWVIETAAGILERDELPEEAIKREIVEEIGYRLQSLHPISTFFVSPGGTSERIFLYLAIVRTADRIAPGGGLGSEGEDIQIIEWDVDTFFNKVEAGEIMDAKTILAGLWFKEQIRKGAILI
jgi:nudix-type nucleoside diphosphatase (YffH/AdpP family)